MRKSALYCLVMVLSLIGRSVETTFESTELVSVEFVALGFYALFLIVFSSKSPVIAGLAPAFSFSVEILLFRGCLCLRLMMSCAKKLLHLLIIASTSSYWSIRFLSSFELMYYLFNLAAMEEVRELLSIPLILFSTVS